MSLLDLINLLNQSLPICWHLPRLIIKEEKEKWLQEKLIVMVFGSEITPDEVRRRLGYFGIKPNILYAKDKSYFRLQDFMVIMLLDKQIMELREAKFIRNNLNVLFPEAKMEMKNFNTAGGNKASLLSEDPISKKRLIDILNIISIGNDNGRLRNLYSLNETNENLGFNNYCLSLNNNNSNFSDSLQLTKFEPDMIAKDVKIFNDFLKGKTLSFLELFGIATSLHWYSGGAKFYRSTMEKFNEMGCTTYTFTEMAIISYVNKIKHLPLPLKNYSKYIEDARFTDLTYSVDIKKGFVAGSNNKEKVSLESAMRNSKAFLNKIIDKCSDPASEKKIYILKGATGVGKTELITDIPNSIIAAPTNTLKEEIYKRMKIAAVATPDNICFNCSILQSEIEKLYFLGLHESAHSLIKKVSRSTADKYSDIDKIIAKSYLELSKKIETGKEGVPIITTHHRAAFQNFKKNILIFDEDPLDLFIPIGKLTLDDVVNLKGSDPTSSELFNRIAKLCLSIEPGIVNKTYRFDCEKAPEVHKIDMEGKRIVNDINGFLNSSYYYKDPLNPADIYYITKRPFPKDIDILIMSATASEWIYSLLLGERYGEVLDVSNVEHKGKILQDLYYSGSKTSIRGNLQKFKSIIKDDIVITHKEFASTFEKGVQEVYFGNCSGYDALKGKNITVLGTPHFPEVTYLLIAAVLGFDVNNMDKKMKRQQVERNGQQFLFTCFNDLNLRRIQLDLIEAQLIQAIGRARAVREDVVVKVFSNLPLYITTMYMPLFRGIQYFN